MPTESLRSQPTARNSLAPPAAKTPEASHVGNEPPRIVVRQLDSDIGSQRITLAPTVMTFDDGSERRTRAPTVMTVDDRSERRTLAPTVMTVDDGSERRTLAPTVVTDDDGLTEHRAFMTGGLREWLKSSKGRNRSGESVVSMLRNSIEYSRTMSVADRHRTQRLRSYSRRSSRATQLNRERSSRRRSRAPYAGSETSASAIMPPPKRRLRITAIFPFLLSAAAFSCSLTLVLAGSKDNLMTNVNIVSFHITNLGTGLIEFAPASSTETASSSETTSTAALGKRKDIEISGTPTITTIVTPPAKLYHRSPFDPLDPFGLVPVLSSVIVSHASADTSVLNSIGSQITSALPLPTISIPGLTSGNGTFGSGFLSSIGGLIEGGLSSLLDTVVAGLGLTSITQAIDDKLNEAVTDLISAFLDGAGVRDYYSLYTLSTCYGSSASDIEGCSEFSSTANSFSSIGSVIPSHIVVVGTNVSSPALAEMTQAISTLGPIVSGMEKFFLALMILSLINSGIAIIFSFLGIFFPINRIILYVNLSLTTLGFITRLLDTILATAISVILSWVVNKFGNTLGMSANIGAIFITLVWLGFLFQTLASGFWDVVWFVEFRQVSFRKRRREKNEVGNYTGVLREVVSDLSLAKQERENEKDIEA